MANAMIYGLISQAMKKVGAIGKDSVNQQQKYKFRGIDAVYNALNPVMAELGLFICPEILDQKREERRSIKEYDGQKKETVLLYSVLTIKYTMFAPDGSSVSCTVVGEGMDSGDKASNKAMSVALKYACFQLFMIPTEEMIDPDAESHEVLAKKTTQKDAQKNTPVRTNTAPSAASVQTVDKIPAKPQDAPKKPVTPVLEYLAREREELRVARQMTKAENAALFNKQTEVLKGAGLAPNKALSEYTQKEAESLVQMMYTRFAQTGTELLADDGKTA